MRWFELMEGSSESLFNRYGGRIMKFAQLPVAAQKAVNQYLVIECDGDDFSDDDLFGYVLIPTEALQHACMTAPDNEFGHDDWADYHADYWSGERDSHYSNHLAEMRPVILDDGEGILDGWHRLHWYCRNGVEQIPSILLVNQDISESKRKRKRRKHRAPIGIGYGYYWGGLGNDSGQGPDGGGDSGGGDGGGGGE